MIEFRSFALVVTVTNREVLRLSTPVKKTTKEGTFDFEQAYQKVILSNICHLTHGKVCPRDRSRVVAKLVGQNLFPTFSALRVTLSPHCKFSPERDMYSVQEDHKVFGGSSRWTCDFCGKAFVSEYFLDRHFENRHPEQVQTTNAICLADVCDVFRCDIISGASQPDYWDIALCLEDDMQELLSQCKELVDGCIPSGLTNNETETLKNQMMDSICSFLTCSKFWNTPYHQEENTHTALYIVLITMTCFGIVVYNFVFYNYFYSDLSDVPYDPTPKVKHRIRKYEGPSAIDVSRHARQRTANVVLEPA